jgi:hypothetical protein
VASATYVDEIDGDLLAQATFFVPIYMGPVANLALMSRMPRLRICQLLTAGFEVALAHLPAGVALCNAAGVHDASTAEARSRLDDREAARPGRCCQGHGAGHLAPSSHARTG